MDYYIILKDGVVYNKCKGNSNCLPFTKNEAQQKIKELSCDDATCINISEDIRNEEIDIEDSQFLNEEENLVYIWRKSFLDNNINGFSMPKCVSNNDEYIDELKRVFEKYKKEVIKIAFKYEKDLVNDVNKNCDSILEALKMYLSGNNEKAKLMVASLIKNYINDPFWVSDLDKSYAFRAVAPFIELHSNGYEGTYKNMMDGDIDFYRARTEKIKRDRKEVLHIPFNLLHRVREQRFSLEKQPCLYLGTTSYVCWKECREPSLDDFYLSGFRANEVGKKLKIFNLVASEALLNGIYQKGENDTTRQSLQNSMIKLLPIVFATSFVVDNELREGEKYEYIIPHLVMQSLSELNIDGVAYLSKRGKDDFQYPQGVNLAIPILDIDNKKQYSDICNKFTITEPKGFYEYINNFICKFMNTSINQDEYRRGKSYLHRAFNDYYSTKMYRKNFSNYLLVDDIISEEEYKLYSSISID